jgi:hypothetical protein|tara:strand:- start:79 stop:630 length:552 start_codon:yes stop_codon:yes gene_type:complete
MENLWEPEEFRKLLGAKDMLSEGETFESHIRSLAKTYLRNWRTAKIYPVVGYHEKFQEMPALIGVAVVGTPRKDKAVYLFGIEDEDLPDKLIEWIDTVMEVGDGLDCICEIMLAYHRAIIPINGESLLDYWTIFDEVVKGERSTNYLKLNAGKEAKVSAGNLLTYNTIFRDENFDKDFRKEWI